MELFITSKPILDDLLNHFDVGTESRNEAYLLYALGLGPPLENLICKHAGLPNAHDNI